MKCTGKEKIIDYSSAAETVHCVHWKGFHFFPKEGEKL